MNRLLLFTTYSLFAGLSEAADEISMPGKVIEASLITVDASKYVNIRCESSSKFERYELLENLKGWDFELTLGTKTGCTPGHYLAVVSKRRLLLFLGASPSPTYRATLNERNI